MRSSPPPCKSLSLCHPGMFADLPDWVGPNQAKHSRTFMHATSTSRVLESPFLVPDTALQREACNAVHAALPAYTVNFDSENAPLSAENKLYWDVNVSASNG